MRVLLHLFAILSFLGGGYLFVTGINVVIDARREAADDGMAALGAFVGYQAASTPLIVGALLMIGAVIIGALDDAASRIVAEIQRGGMQPGGALRQHLPPPPPPPPPTDGTRVLITGRDGSLQRATIRQHRGDTCDIVFTATGEVMTVATRHLVPDEA